MNATSSPVDLSKPTIRIVNKTDILDKLDKCKNGGASNLLVVTDFDFTITRSKYDNGLPAILSDGIFDGEITKKDPLSGQLVTFIYNNKFLKRQLEDDNHLQIEDMKKMYSPLEHDLLLSMEEKIPHMETWWRAVLNLIIQGGFNRSSLQRLIKEAENFRPRDGCVKFFEQLDALGIPAVIYSAGIGDIIESLFALSFDRVRSNLHIISNWMVFDDRMNIVGFKPPLIHCFNKSANVIPKDAPFLSEVAKKSNVLLLGDNIGDSNLWKGLVPNGSNILKIGFFNRQNEDHVSKFTEVYDIVLVDDQTFDIPIELIQYICGS